ncbi:fatty acid desaturase [Roseobacteraceae bacterium S113]
MHDRLPRQIEWPTLLLLIATYLAWAGALFLPVWMAIPAVALIAALHASLSHEALHGHPTRWAWLNDALVFPVLSLCVPYLRFKDTHLAHHLDSRLTDPYEDPESNYLDPAQWRAMPTWQKWVFRAHNTLAGRMLLGPLLGQVRFMAADWALIREGNARVALGWGAHVPSVALVLWLVWLSPMALWAYLVACYLSVAILRIRTFLEHQAHEHARGRTVIIEDRGLLAFLFLNNNLHVVHHMHPRVPWYGLPGLYAKNSARYLAQNEGYRFGSYREIFARFFLRAKDPVPHPLYEEWRR